MFRTIFLRRVTFEKLLCGPITQLQGQPNVRGKENIIKESSAQEGAHGNSLLHKAVPECHAKVNVQRMSSSENEKAVLETLCGKMRELDPHAALPIALASKLIMLYIKEHLFVEVLKILTTHPHLEELTTQTIASIEYYGIMNILTPTLIVELLEVLTCAEVHYVERWLVLFAEYIAQSKCTIRKQEATMEIQKNLLICNANIMNNNAKLEQEAKFVQKERNYDEDDNSNDNSNASQTQSTEIKKQENYSSSTDKIKEERLQEEEERVKALEWCSRKLHDSIMRLVKIHSRSHYPAVLLRALCQVSDGSQRADREDVLYVLQLALNACNNHNITNNTNNNNDNNNKTIKRRNATNNYANQEENTSPMETIINPQVFINPDYFSNVLRVIVDEGKDYRRAVVLWKWMQHSSACWDVEAVSSVVIAFVQLRELTQAIQCLQTLSEVNCDPTIPAQVALITYLGERSPALPAYADKLVQHWYNLPEHSLYSDCKMESSDCMNETNNSNNNNNNNNNNCNNSNYEKDEEYFRKTLTSDADKKLAAEIQIHPKIWFGASQDVGFSLIFLHFKHRHHEVVLQLLRQAAFALTNEYHKVNRCIKEEFQDTQDTNLFSASQEQQKLNALNNIVSFIQHISITFVLRHFAKDVAFNAVLRECFYDIPVKFAALNNKPLMIGALIVIEREISASRERYVKDSVVKTTTETKEGAAIKAESTESIVQDNPLSTRSARNHTTLNEELKQKEAMLSMEPLLSLECTESIYRRLASVVIDDFEFAELARFLADEQNNNFSPVERLHLIRSVASHLRCSVPREVRGWLELLGTEDDNKEEENNICEKSSESDQE